MTLDLSEVQDIHHYLSVFGLGTDLVVIDDKVEIRRGDDRFEVLCAMPDHPYCRESEDRFGAYLNRKKPLFESIILRDQSICIYLRNQRTFQVEQVFFRGDILQKKFGVYSGLVFKPEEFFGLMCAPPRNGNAYWTVSRPFNRDNLGVFDSSNKNVLAAPHVCNFPSVTPVINEAQGLSEMECRDFSLDQVSDPFILSNMEANTYLTCDRDFSIVKREGDRFLLRITSESSSLEGREEQTVLIRFKSPYQWLKMPNQVPNFDRSWLMSDGYSMFLKGTLIQEGNSYYFVPLGPLPAHFSEEHMKYSLYVESGIGRSLSMQQHEVALKIDEVVS